MQVIAADASAPAVVIVSEPGAIADSREAAAAIGGRIVAERSWDAMAGGAGLPAGRALFVVEMRGVDPDRLAAGLPRLVEASRAVDARVVASLYDEAIDIAAAFLDGGEELLCNPALVDQVLACAVAARGLGAAIPHDTTAYEGEAARLRRLNEEVARLAEVLARLTSREADERASIDTALDRRAVFAAPPSDAIVIDAGEIRRAIRGRRLRDQFFGPGLFEEPGWDMILDLFAAELERRRVSVSSLCIAASVAPTTALRWISKLVEAGLFERRPDPFDRRRAYLELSDRASRGMRDYIAAMRHAGLSLS